MSSAAGDRQPGRRVAVMQPYFFPYAGYFRLFASCDEFVIFDCVQFPRRGRVHRTQVLGVGGRAEWLTLPLAGQPMRTPIRNLAFAADARVAFNRRLARVTLARPRSPAALRVVHHLGAPLESVVDYLETGLRLVANVLGFHTHVTRSSTLDIDPSLRGQDRVLAIAQARGATTYVNPPGGRDLYDPDRFAREGIRLEFLPNYRGQYYHLLPALLQDAPDMIRADVLRQCGTGPDTGRAVGGLEIAVGR